MRPPTFLDREMGQDQIFANLDEKRQKDIIDLIDVYEIWNGAYKEAKKCAINSPKGSPEWDTQRASARCCIAEMKKTSDQITTILYSLT